ncbi:hypothetical protein NAEGRDRAFT_80751 [Naegleria gruberi]|uniref:DUF4116 domain-containing protein n=1 Tax=Naegleria gruberi TaxID=5762 RepID=D2VPE9_NAEGR|nr:uncharacterized protein NAEGRDRAFT_80751 [Naegleria gruberi]EFC41417.1 hypothetical protein NAEGRDRAFT_80751 [Naegleria gruberi]|eukprot:XP_002674161.1 hypothetical protein NAEGRDRAFT_80751 [Naegleria gruberi strain NEG-M]
MINLDFNIKSNLLFSKFKNQRKSFLKYCSKRDEILKNQPRYIPLEYYRDCHILVKYPHLLRNLSILNDQDFILYFLIAREHLFGIKIDIPDKMRQDPNFIVKAIKANHQIFPKLFPKDEPVSFNFKYGNADLKLKENSDIFPENLVNYFVKLNPEILKFVNWKEVDRELVIEILSKNISLCMNGDRELTLLAIECNPNALKFANIEFRNDEEIVLKAISQDKNLLQYATVSMIERILGNNELIDYSAEDRVNLILNGYPELFKYLPKHLKSDEEFLRELIKKDARLIQFIPEYLMFTDKEVKWIKYMEGNLEYIELDPLENSREEDWDLLSRFKSAIYLAPKYLRENKEFVLKCLKYHPECISSTRLQFLDDEEVMSFVLSKVPELFCYASDRLKDDKEFVMKYLDQYPEMFKYLSRRLGTDKELILKYVSCEKEPNINLSPFLNDEEFMLKLAERNPNLVNKFKGVSPEILRNLIEQNNNVESLISQYSNSESEEEIELAALSIGYLVEKHTCTVSSCKGKLPFTIRPSISVSRNQVDSWIKKRLEKEFDGLYIPLSTAMFVKGCFITEHISVYTSY